MIKPKIAFLNFANAPKTCLSVCSFITIFQCHSPPHSILRYLLDYGSKWKCFQAPAVSFGAKENVTPLESLSYCRRYANISRRNTVLNLIEILDSSLLVVGSHENISVLEIGNTTITTRSFQLRGKMPSKICLSYLAKIYVTRCLYLFVYQEFYTAVQVNWEPSCHLPILSCLPIIRSQLLWGLFLKSPYNIRATYLVVWLQMHLPCNQNYDYYILWNIGILQENHNMVLFSRTPP
jgi:hypothetical protein